MLLIFRHAVRSPVKPSQYSDQKPIELTPLTSDDEGGYFGNSKINHKSRPSLFLALCRTYIVMYLTAGFLKLINDLLNFVGPQVLKLDLTLLSSRTIILHHPHRLLIEYIKNPDDPEWRGYFYACLLFVSTLTQSLVLQHYFHRSFVLGMHLKSSIISIVYNKVCHCCCCMMNE